MAMQRFQFGTIVAVAMTVIVVSVLALSAYMTYQMQGLGNVVESKGVCVYWNNNCTSNVTVIDWGFLRPGETVDLPVYIKNEGTVSRILSINTSDWNPIRAFGNVTLNWNREGYVLNSGEMVQAVLTLVISPDIDGVTNFSFKITITATEYA